MVTIDTGETHTVVDGVLPVYSRTGHVCINRRAAVWGLGAALFAGDLESVGEAFPVAERAAFVTVSDDDTLIYVTEDRAGTSTTWVAKPRRCAARSGRCAAGWHRRDGAFAGRALGGRLQHGKRKPRSLDTGCAAQNCKPNDVSPEPESLPRWSPTGAEVIYNAYRSGNWDVLIRATDGSGEPRIVAGTSRDEFSTDWSADGNFLLLTVTNRLYDLWYAKRSAKGFELFPLLETEFDEQLAVFSPDGRYFAHCSLESGREQVYVRRFPDGSGKVRVSQNGGCKPQWSRDGKEVFYIEGDALFSVPVNLVSLLVGEPKVLFRDGALNTSTLQPYAVSADGKRILLAEPVEDGKKPPTIHVVQNWFAEFQKPTPLR